MNKLNLENEFTEYLSAVYGKCVVSDIQKIEIKRAFFAGVNLLLGYSYRELSGEEENIAVECLIDINKQLKKFVKEQEGIMP